MRFEDMTVEQLKELLRQAKEETDKGEEHPLLKYFISAVKHELSKRDEEEHEDVPISNYCED
jgi:hypothetical protein